MSNFVHLHVHSHYSLLDGLPKIKELVKTAKDRGFKALALTDHGSMYGAIEFYQECLNQEIKPIIGFEAYVAPKSMTDKDTNDRYSHLLLLAENNTGYQNLMKLSTIGHLEGFYYKPRVDKKVLKENHEGIIAASACFGGELARAMRSGNYEKAKKVALEYQEIFGENNYFLEMMDLPALEGQTEYNNNLIKLSKDTGIPLIVTRDVHYLNKEDAEAQDILTCIRDGRTIDEPNRQTMMGLDCSFARGNDIESRFTHIKEAIENTEKIADRVNVVIELNKWHFAEVDLIPGKNADETLEAMVYDNVEKFMPLTDEVEKRIKFELDIIQTKGYSPYFICVADYVKFAKDNGIVETTRGSGAGSLVSYVTGITTVDPLRFNLPFERFLNPYRPSPPDVDTDFADDRREEMIEYATRKYGADKVAQIITFGTMAARGSVRDVGRALGLSYSFCDQIAKLIPMGAQGFPMTIAIALKDEPDLKKLYNSNDDVKRLLNLAQKVEGSARHTSIHAAGVVISPTPLINFTPLQRESGGEKITTQYEMHSVETAGVLKMDFLGIRNLAMLGRAVEIVEKTLNEKVDIYNLPLDDRATFEMISRGETMATFQLSGSGMTRWIKELKPERIDDIMAMIALFRPGPMAIIPEYIARKRGQSEVKFYHPKMEKFLDKSFGLLVYQDDLLFTAIELAGYNWETVDKFRKAVGKKIPEEMARQHKIFVEGCQKHSGMSKGEAEKIWDLFEPFQGYGFNKAHAASYGIVAYQTAFMKAHYPVQYMTAVLIAESGDMDKVPPIIHECERMGTPVLPPSVNSSFKNFAMTDAPNASSPEMKERIIKNDSNSVIRFGLNGVKNVGEHISDVIFQERKENGTYKDLEDLLTRITDRDLNKKSLESLIKCGALDCFGYDRGMLLNNIENILAFSRQIKDSAESSQNSLFLGTSIDLNNKVRLEDAPDATEDEKLTWEKELLGVYVTAHPYEFFQESMKNVAVDLKDLEDHKSNEWVVVGGIVSFSKKKITKKGKMMMFATIEDTTGSKELLVFPNSYEKTKDAWVEGNIVCVLAKTSEEGDEKLFVDKAYLMDKENVDGLKNMFSMNTSSTSIENESEPVKNSLEIKEDFIEIIVDSEFLKINANKIKEVLVKHPGELSFYILVGDKKIKTSYQINPSEEFKKELEEIL